MKRNLMFLVVLLVALPTLTFSQMEPGSPAQARIQKEVRHELLMLPYFGVFDNIEYRGRRDCHATRRRDPAYAQIRRGKCRETH